jgi:hypothetical protein
LTFNFREEDMPKGRQEVKVHMPNELKGGVYSNNMVVNHTREEFILDFLMVAPPEGAVNSRVIVSPGHIKRIYEALKENISKYEQSFGAIKAAEEPKTFI